MYRVLHGKDTTLFLFFLPLVFTRCAQRNRDRLGLGSALILELPDVARNRLARFTLFQRHNELLLSTLGFLLGARAANRAHDAGECAFLARNG